MLECAYVSVGCAPCIMIFARFKPCRHGDGGLDLDPACGGSSALHVAVRLNGGCLLQIKAAGAVRELYCTVANALRTVVMDMILSFNCSRLSSNDIRELRLVGMGDGSVIECAFGMRGGMQGAAETGSAVIRRGANEQVRQCLYKVQNMNSKLQNMKPLLDQAMLSIPRPIASDAGAVESSWLAAAALQDQETKVTWRVGGLLWWAGVGKG